MNESRVEPNYVHLKTVAVGDGAVGKTCMFLSFITGEFPQEYVPQMLDACESEDKINGIPCKLTLQDTDRCEDYPRLRPINFYPGTNVFMLCFDVLSSSSSFDHIETNWIPELRHHCPDVPIILVGTKIDLRGGEKETISTKAGKSLAKKIGAAKYCEISSKDGTGIKQLFKIVLRIGNRHYLLHNKKEKSLGCCR